MSCETLKGAPVAAALDEKTKIKVLALEQKGICPCLAILRVGERPDDMAYERAAVKRCEKVGVQVRRIILPEDVSQAELISEIEKLNADSGVHGVLMFRPLPKPLDEKAACLALDPRKDIDGITVGSMSRVFSGSGDGFSPCTAQSVMEILNYYGVEISGKRATVIGRSLVIGRPAAMLLMAANATVTICHSKTEDMPSVVRDADIVVAAIGKGEAIGAEHLRAGQTVIDVGMNWSEEKQKFVGDVRLDEAEQTVRAVTPVPGGVGSVTTSVLVSHVVEVADR
jgi:methylenetetrahydrofolate dehydrogenase (NADP+) / methenyltetrahydrofolate cyclohydrolase